MPHGRLRTWAHRHLDDTRPILESQHDNALDDYDGLERLDRLLQARKVVLRFVDGPRVVEVPVSPRARTAMRHVRDAYQAMSALKWLEIRGP